MDVVKEDYQCPIDAQGNTSWSCINQKNSPDPSSYYYKYTSGVVVSKCITKFTYGYVEAKMSFPSENGTHNAFWARRSDCAQNYTGANEIDIAEIKGKWTHIWNGDSNGYYDRMTSNIHLCYDTDPVPCLDPDHIENYYMPANSTSAYHIYGLYWTPDSIKIYIDGQLRHAYPNFGVHDPVSLLFSCTVDSSFHDYANFSNTPVSVSVDWVRVYKEKDPTVLILEKKPYIINPEDDPNNVNKKRITIKWQLPTGVSSSTICSVDWGLTTMYGNNISINDNTTTDHLYHAVLSNLEPSTKYYYSIQGAGYNYSGDFITPPNENETNISFYATGAKVPYDFNQIFNYDDISNEILNQIQQDPNSQNFLIQLNGFVTGDNEEFWRTEFFRYSPNTYNVRTKLALTGPIANTERKIKCLDYTDDIIGDKADGIGLNFRKYLPFNYESPYLNSLQDFEYNHSLDYGPVHICFPEIIYKNTSLSDPGMTYMEMDLIRSQKEWNVLSFNYPLKSLNGDVLDEYAHVIQKAKDNGVQLILMGGEDYYAHWVDEGIHFLILGDGGTTTNSIDDQKLANDNELVCASTAPHFAKFRIEDNLMYVDVIQGADYYNFQKGHIIDQFAIPKECYITDNQTWNSGSYPIVTDVVWVATGGELTIESEVQILKDESIVVTTGGVLNVDGANAYINSHDGFNEIVSLVTKDAAGNITNSYLMYYTQEKSYWRGISVKSTPNQNQLDMTKQGVVNITNGATIAYAENAIATKQEIIGSNGHCIGYNGGGIIRTENAIFKNNITDIQMNPYQNTRTFNNGTTVNLADRSRILETSFITDDDFIINNTTASVAPKHIVLNGVRGLLIYGSNFENQNTSFIRRQKGVGILAIESSINLSNVSVSTSSPLIPNTFEDLSYGVKTYNSNENGITTIQGNTFNNCYKSIYLDNSFSSEVIDNTISVPESETANGYSQLPYGIYLDGGRGFKVENNNISGFSTTETFGIIVHGTGDVNNQIYRNTLTNLGVGTQAQNSNFGVQPIGSDIGLHFLCNDYNGDYDIRIDKSANYIGNTGIASDQSMYIYDYSIPDYVQFPAGNIFSSTTRIADYDFNNVEGNNPNGCYYFYEDDASIRYEPTYISNVIPIELLNSNSCPDNTDVTNTTGDLYLKLANAQVGLNSAEVILNIWKDGGNLNLDYEVETTLPWDAYVQFNELITESPYLSDEVLIEAIENTAFSSLMIKLIMIANPQSSRNEEIIGLLLDRIPIMPQSYIDEILDEKETISQLDLLEGDVSSYNHLVRTIGDDIKYNYRNDTINAYAQDSLIDFLSRQTELSDKYELVSQYLKDSNYSAANTTLVNIPINNTMTDEELEDYNQYLNIFDVATQMCQNQDSTNSLDGTQLFELENALYSNTGQVSQLALSLLLRNNIDYEYDEEVLLPSIDSTRSISFNYQNDIEKDPIFKVYPNPASDYITIEYKIEDIFVSSANIIIYDANGKAVLTKVLNSNFGEELIGIDKLSKGFYTINLYAENEIIASDKFTKIR